MDVLLCCTHLFVRYTYVNLVAKSVIGPRWDFSPERVIVRGSRCKNEVE